ncbi:hypothetical protein KI387_043310, partial [Taxus chinensis]
MEPHLRTTSKSTTCPCQRRGRAGGRFWENFPISQKEEKGKVGPTDQPEGAMCPLRSG